MPVLHALRLVEMQLNAEPVDTDTEDVEPPTPQAPSQPNKAVAEFDSRRCHLCRAPFPPFGFGPPLSGSRMTVWACRAHQDTLSDMLTTNTHIVPEAQIRFL